MDILRGFNSECVDLIYLDPPFNSKANYAAPIGSQAAGAAFKDTWGLDDINLAWHGEIKHEHPGLYDLLNATRRIHGDSMMSYLIYMAVRIMELKRVLKSTGSFYLHCDWRVNSYIRLALDEVFGPENFRNELIWHYGGRGAKAIAKQFPRNHDILLFYGKSSAIKFNRQTYTNKILFEGSNYKLDDKGRCFRTSPRGDYTDESIRQLEAEGRIFVNSKGTIRIKYFERYDGKYVYEQKLVGDTWNDLPDAMHIPRYEKTGYPTQKPVALLERIIKASSHEGDMILDPFCGCATTCVAAQRLGRRWIGIDISPKASELVKVRMGKEAGFFYKGAIRTDIPQRTDLGKIIPYNDPQNKRHLYGEQGGYCNGCEHHFHPQNFTVDHIIPRSKGGTDHISNLQLLCGNCNSIKGPRTQEDLLVALTDKGYIKRKHAA